MDPYGIQSCISIETIYKSPDSQRGLLELLQTEDRYAG